MTWGGFRISRRALAGLVAAAAVVAPAQAGAATAGMAGGTIGIGGGSEASSLTVTRVGADIVVADALAAVSAADGCKAKGRTVACPSRHAERLVAVLSDAADTFDASAAPIRVAVWSRGGDDTLHTRNGFTDYVSCGAGSDSGSVDAADVLYSDCENTLDRPIGAAPTAAPPAPEPAGTTATDVPGTQPTSNTGGGGDAGGGAIGGPAGVAAPTAPAPVAIKTPATIPLSRKGVIAIGVSCTADAGVCAGTVELVEEGGAVKARAVVHSARRRKAPKKKTKATLLGRAKFSVRAGASKQVRISLSRRGRRRIIKKKKRKTRAKIVISMRAPDGTVTTTEKKVSIAAPKERRSSARRGSGKKRAAKRRGRGR